LQALEKCEVPEPLSDAFDTKPIACYKAMDYLLVFEDEETIHNAQPSMQKLSELDLRGVIITAKSREYDFVTRFFAPKFGIDEDPVTGSAFTQLLPYWSEVLNKSSLHGKQVSRRGGEVFCEIQEKRVLLSGYAISFLEGIITLD